MDPMGGFNNWINLNAHSGVHENSFPLHYGISYVRLGTARRTGYYAVATIIFIARLCLISELLSLLLLLLNHWLEQCLTDKAGISKYRDAEAEDDKFVLLQGVDDAQGGRLSQIEQELYEVEVRAANVVRWLCLYICL